MEEVWSRNWMARSLGRSSRSKSPFPKKNSFGKIMPKNISTASQISDFMVE